MKMSLRKPCFYRNHKPMPPIHSLNETLDFFETPADCSLFHLADRHMTAELQRGGHRHPTGSLSRRDLPKARAIFAHHDLFVVGMIVVRYHVAAKLARFYRLWVEPAARKGGIGQALMESAERRIVELGGKTIECKPRTEPRLAWSILTNKG